MAHRALIVAAGGNASRFGGGKLLQLLAGKPILQHSLERFAPLVQTVIVAAPPPAWEEYRRIADAAGVPATLVAGGAVRGESVANALAALPEECALVAIHDAARPLTRPQLLEDLFRMAERLGAAIPAHRVTDTVKEVDADCVITATLARDRLALVETPQVFRCEVLRRALAAASERGGEAGFPDEAALLEAAGIPVPVLYHDSPNPKLTWPGDLAWLEFLAARSGNS